DPGSQLLLFLLSHGRLHPGVRGPLPSREYSSLEVRRPGDRDKSSRENTCRARRLVRTTHGAHQARGRCARSPSRAYPPHTAMTSDSVKPRGSLQVGGKTYEVFSLDVLAKSLPAVRQLPFSLRVLLENLLRHEDGRVVKREHVEKMLAWIPKAAPDTEISFH